MICPNLHVGGGGMTTVGKHRIKQLGVLAI